MSTPDIDISNDTATTAAKKAQAKAQTMRAGRANADEPTVEVYIPKGEKEKGDVYVGHNFRTFQIQRGVWVRVPECVLTSLELAIRTEYVAEERPDGRVALEATDVMSVPFQIRR